MFHGIADNPAPGGCCAVNPEVRANFLQVLIELNIGNPRFDHRIGHFFVDLQHLVHPFHVNDQIAVYPGGRTTITKVFAGAVIPDWDFEPICQADDLLGLLDIGWCNRGTRNAKFSGGRRHSIQVGAQFGLRVGEYPLGPNNINQGSECLGKSCWINVRWRD